MTPENSPDPEDKMLTEDERDVQRRFQETLGRLVNTPHKKHEPIGVKTPARKSANKKGKGGASAN